jgi:AcrR family transcriptional regulator
MAVNRVLTLRERKKVETRRAIEEAAVQLFLAGGFDATTVDEIAAAADVSPRTFHRYFATKEEVVLGTGAEEAEQIVAVLRSRPVDEPLLDSLRMVVLAQADEWERDRGLMLDQLRLVLRTPSLRARYLEVVQGCIDPIAKAVGERSGGRTADRAQASLEARAIAGAVIGMATAVIELWVETGGDEELPLMIHRGLDVLAAAFCGP